MLNLLVQQGIDLLDISEVVFKLTGTQEELQKALGVLAEKEGTTKEKLLNCDPCGEIGVTLNQELLNIEYYMPKGPTIYELLSKFKTLDVGLQFYIVLNSTYVLEYYVSELGYYLESDHYRDFVTKTQVLTEEQELVTYYKSCGFICPVEVEETTVKAVSDFIDKLIATESNIDWFKLYDVVHLTSEDVDNLIKEMVVL